MTQQEIFTKTQFWAELDEAGEDIVRERVIAERYGHGNHKLELAREWLRLKDVARSNEREQQHLGNERSAKNAAWVSAIAAATSVVVSLVALYFSLRT